LKLAPAATTLLDRNGHFFTLSRSGIALPAAAQDIASAKPNIVSTDENRNEKSGKGAEYSPASRRPVARDLIMLEAGGA
jgi:hypothetical protein